MPRAVCILRSQTATCLRCSGALLEAANSAIFGLGPLGSYEVGIQGKWLPDASQAGSTVQVAFDAFSVKMVGYLGLQLPAGLPKVRFHGARSLYGCCSGSRGPWGVMQITIPINGQTTAEWCTPYADEEFRLGKGKSGNLFLFQRS